MKTKITDVEVITNAHSGDTCVAWKADGARFHYWSPADDADLMPRPSGKDRHRFPTLYKNPPRDGDSPRAKRLQRTRHLDATIPKNAAMIEEVRRVVRFERLVDQAIARGVEVEATRLAAAAAEHAERLKQRAGPALYAALRAILPLAEDYLRSAPSHPDHAKIDDARAAVAIAEGAES